MTFFNRWPDPPAPEIRNGLACHDGDKIRRWQIELRKHAAQFLPHFGFGQCGCCGLPWWIVEGHTIQYSESEGCFAICELCWSAMWPEEAAKFYVEWAKEQKPEVEDALLLAVLQAPHPRIAHLGVDPE